MPHEQLTNDPQANALYQALARAGRKREKEKGMARNSRGIYSVLNETSLTGLVTILTKNLNKLGYEIVEKKSRGQRS